MKSCAACQKPFPRPYKYSCAQWAKARYCSSFCAVASRKSAYFYRFMSYPAQCKDCGEERWVSYGGYRKAVTRGVSCLRCNGRRQILILRQKGLQFRFRVGEKHHITPHSPKSRELIRKNTPIRYGKDNNKFKDGRSLKPDYRAFIENIRRVRKMKNGGSHSYEEWSKLKAQFKDTCPMCEKKEPEITLGKDHVIPISKGGTDSITNLQPLCTRCNSRKYNKIIDFRQKILC